MALKALKPQLIFDFKLFFGKEPNDNRISIIKHICKKSILFEIAGLNYRLKPINKLYFDNSLKTQLYELKYFTKTKKLCLKYYNTYRKYIKNKNEFALIFNRPACLFAIEEILNSKEMQTIENFDMNKEEVWEAIINYLLAVNYFITENKTDPFQKFKNLESLNPIIIPFNEQIVATDQLFIPYRGYWLINYLLNNSALKNEVVEYFKESYDIDPLHFVHHILSMYFGNNRENSNYNFFYYLKDRSGFLFEKLSRQIENNETYKLLTIRKSPFIKVDKNSYLLTDNSLLVEKVYSQFLNDFWFDKIKKAINDNGKLKFTFKYYRSIFGLFFEKYLSESLRKCFENFKYSKLLMFENLKVQTKRGEIEIADVYLRSKNKILLGQVKSNSIYDKEKFSASTEVLYKRNRNQFFSDFGVNQIFDSLTKMDEYIIDIDPGFPKGHSYTIYPCLIVNDKVFQTPLMSNAFNIRFQELLKGFNIKKVKVRPLTVIHISDIEGLEEYLNKDPKMIWELLKTNHEEKNYIPPFHFTTNQKIKERKYPKRIFDLYENLISKYSPKQEDKAKK